MAIFHETDAVQPCAAANPAIALGLQACPLGGRVAELGSLGVINEYGRFPIILR